MSGSLATLRRKMKGLMLSTMPGMITCAEFDEFIMSYLDGSLAPRERRLFERHIWLCRECREYLAAYKRTIEIGKAVFREPLGPVPDDVPDDLVDAVLSARRK